MTDKELAGEICGEIWAECTRPAVRFTLEPGEPGLTDSKTAGTPYLPRGMAWPADSGGKPLEFLAQINCAQLSGLPDFPAGGMLQFFIGWDDVYGVDFEDMTRADGFRVLYHETVDPSAPAPDCPRPPENSDFSPVARPCRICFAPVLEMKLTEQDYRFERQFLRRWNGRRPGEPLKTLWDFLKRIPREERDEAIFNPNQGKAPWHQLGGYPFFTQEDPRPGLHEELDTLLFQLDSDMRGREDLVLWGDCGVANFFISREDLKNRDFSRVGYSWDCC